MGVADTESCAESVVRASTGANAGIDAGEDTGADADMGAGAGAGAGAGTCVGIGMGEEAGFASGADVCSLPGACFTIDGDVLPDSGEACEARPGVVTVNVGSFSMSGVVECCWQCKQRIRPSTVENVVESMMFWHIVHRKHPV